VRVRRGGGAAGRRGSQPHPPVPVLRWCALAALLPSCPAALLSCARIEPPPGGPPDRTPPRLIATRPADLSSFRGFHGVAEFQFDEVVSEGGTPNRGEGTGGLEKLVIVSPTTRVPE